MGSGWNGLVPCTSQSCESNKRVYTGQLHGSLGSTGLRPIPPHYYRDPAHGPGVGSGLLPRLPPPTCSRPVSGVGLGPFVMRLLCCSLPAPARRQFFALRFATVCHSTYLSLSVSLLGLEPLSTHALLAFSLLARRPHTTCIIPVFPARCHLTYLSLTSSFFLSLDASPKRRPTARTQTPTDTQRGRGNARLWPSHSGAQVLRRLTRPASTFTTDWEAQRWTASAEAPRWSRALNGGDAEHFPFPCRPCEERPRKGLPSEERPRRGARSTTGHARFPGDLRAQ